MKNLIIEIILGYQFWTLFHGLAPMIWFYPLNELEITGYECFALVVFSPFLCYIPKLSILLNSKIFNIILRSLCLLGIYSFQSSTTLSRLTTLSIGCLAQILLLYLSVNQKSKRTYQIDGLLYGFVLLVACRFCLVSFMPAWWSKELNSLHFLIFFVANIDQLFSGGPEETENDTTQDNCKKSILSTIVSGYAFGSWLYISQALIADSSLICRWTITGYPNTGPIPYPWGFVVFIAMLTGICISYSMLSNLSKTLFFIIGAFSLHILYYFISWTAFIGGVIYAAFLISIFPPLFYFVRINSYSPLCLCVAFLTWLFEILFSVWTVAYNFVPGGYITRERTDILLFIVTTSFLLFFIQLIKASDIQIRSYKFDKKMFIAYFLIFVCFLSGFIYRLPKQNFETPTRARIITSAIWTIHFGYDNDGWPSLESIASVLNNTQADVFVLLESDASKPFLGNNDLAMWLAERLSMYVDFGPSTKSHTWGNLLLSKFPIIKSKHHLLPSPEGELAPAITATLNISGRLLDVAVSHMGNDRDVLDRKLQSEYLAAEIAAMENPVIFMVYLTSAPKSSNYVHYLKAGKLKDIDPTDADRWCQYIFYRNLIRVGYARISHGGLTDTEIQVGRFSFKENDKIDNDRVTSDASKVSTDFLFNPIFGKYFPGHYYKKEHHFQMNTPKYFY